ncbi:MAG: hypothetical protein ACK4YP_24450, partial [Myxococcota bacterium]
MAEALWSNWRGGPLPAALLALPYGARVKAALALARDAARGDADADAILDALSRADAHARRLAAFGLAAHPVAERLLRLSADPSRFVWGRAGKALAARGTAADVQAGLEAAWTMRRHKKLLHWLVARRRAGEVGRFVAWMAERPATPEWVDWLPAADEDTLRRLLPGALERPSQRFWERLARLRPEVLVEVAQAALAARPGPPDGQLRVVLEGTLVRAAEAAPDATLGLVRTLTERGHAVDQAVWSALVARRPGPALELWWGLGRTWGGLSVAAVEKLDGAALERIVAGQLAHLPEPKDWLPKRPEAERARIVAAWLAALPRFPRQLPGLFAWLGEADPAMREAAYAAWSVASRNGEGIVHLVLVEPLPPDLQRREALRHLHEVAALATRPIERMAWMRFLAYEDVEPLVAPYLGHPEPETRGPAVETLLSVCGRDATRPALATV